MRLKALILPVLVSMAFSSTYAAAPVTLKDAVEQAILQNPEVKLRFHDLQAAVAEQDAAKGGFYPHADVTAFTGRETTTTPVIPTTTYTHPFAQIQLTQLLFDGMGTNNEIKRLGFSKLARYYDFLAASDDIALQAAQAYIDVLKYQRLVGLARDNYETHRNLHAQIADRTAAGVGRKVDLEQAAGRMSLAESNWLSEENNLHDVSARYLRLIGAAPTTSLAPVPELEVEGLDKPAFLEQSIHDNPAFKSTVATIRSAKAQARERKASYSPTVQLRANQNYEQNQGAVLGTYRDSGAQIVLNWNLFNGGSDSARIKQAAEQINSSYDLRDKSCRDLKQTLQIARNNKIQLEQQLQLLQQYELSTTKARDAYHQQYDIGQRTLLDLLDTENELFQARRNLTVAEFDLMTAKMNLLANSGRILTALQLRPITADQPEESGDDPDIDTALECSGEVIKTVSLDKSTLAPIPSAPATPAPVVPAVALAETPKPAATEVACSPALKWYVKQGDTLKSIAEFFFGADQKARIQFIHRLHDLNKDLKQGPFEPLPAKKLLMLPALPAGKLIPNDRACLPAGQTPAVVPANEIKNPELRKKVADSEEKMRGMVDGHYLVQLTIASGEHLEHLTKFMARASKLYGNDHLIAFLTQTPSKAHCFAVLVGTYKTAAEANDVISKVPDFIKINRPMIRTVGSVRKEMVQTTQPPQAKTDLVK